MIPLADMEPGADTDDSAEANLHVGDANVPIVYWVDGKLKILLNY